MEILLDTNFILTCVKEKIDFAHRAHELIDEEINWVVPQQVLNELGSLKDRPGMKKKDKDAAELSFSILQQLNPKIVDLGRNPNVDIAIINYTLGKDIVLATLDRELKRRSKGIRFLTIRAKNHLELN